MGHKIFVSYKYADQSVENLSFNVNSTVRDYVDEFEKLLDKTNNIFKGEHEGEDLSGLSEDTIWGKLRDRIYDSTLTIIFISPEMKEIWKSDKEQWIPWEISYSLKETNRTDSSGNSITSKTNAMLAVVLPNSSGSYSYYLEERNCCNSNCTMHYTQNLFQIIRDNKFNLINANKYNCDKGDIIWRGSFSYIEAVKWKDFKNNISYYFDRAYNRQANIENYNITKIIQ